MDTVTKISAFHLVVPLDTPVRVGGYSVHQRDYCLVQLETSSGFQGISFAFTRGGDLVRAVTETLAPFLFNQNVDHIERIWEQLYLKMRLLGRQGIIMRAQSLIDMALWDIKGKKAKLPLYELFGGYRSSVPVLMAGGYYVEGKGDSELCKEFESYIEDGFRSFKIMVGGDTMENDLQRFLTVRKVIPSNMSLAVDANGSWSSPKRVLDWLEKAQHESGQPVSFLEEPLSPERLDDTARIRERTNVPIAIGEFLAGKWEFRQWLEGNTVDIVRADATLCGGYTEWRKISALADCHSLTQIPHYFPSIHIHAALSFGGCVQLEVVSEAGRNSSEHLLVGRSYIISNGFAEASGQNGIGLIVDDGAIQKYTKFRNAAVFTH